MKLLSFKQLETEKGIPFSRVHIGRLVKAGKFPAPIFVGEHRIAWLEPEIDDLIAERAALREKAAA